MRKTFIAACVALCASLTAAFKGVAVQGKSLDVVLRSIYDRLSSKALDAALSLSSRTS